MFKIGDVFVAVILLVAVAVSLYFAFRPSSAENVEIHLNGKIYMVVPLDVDKEIEIDGIGHNKVVIKNKTVKVVDSDCKNHDCEASTISRSGEMIACLPNRLLVKIVGGTTDVVIG